MCLAPITLSTKSGHVQACRLVHGLYMANLTKCFDMMGLYGVICGYMGLYVVICGYMGLYVVIHGYMWLYGVICGYMGLYVVI